MKDRGDFERFLEDLAPFFYRRPVIYVDVGAYDGRTFKKVLQSDLVVNEAHLIEPNARYLDLARAVGAETFHGHSADYYHLALGAQTGRIKLHDAKSMTRVMGPADKQGAECGQEENCFEVDCTTLDELANRFTERRISLLKIDVEGYEMDVLAGAKSLLQDQRVDVLYIEAGMNPEGTQQIYYRRIEDALTAYGYRMFGIYEQKNEWMEDSPVLRRTNMSFLSARFAQSNPYRVTRELYQANRELETLHRDADAGAKRIENLEKELKEARARLATTEQELRQASAARKELASELRSLKSSLEIQQSTLESLRTANRSAAKRLYDAFDCISKVHGRELYARGELLSARAEVARLRMSFSYRLGALLISHARSPLGWIKAPAAVLRELVGHRRRKASEAGVVSTDEIPPIVLSDSKSMWVPLTRKPQVLVANCGERDWDIWITAHAAGEATVTVAVQTLGSNPKGCRSRVDQHQRHRDLMIRRLKLKSGVPTRLCERASGDLSLKLVRELGRFCVLKVKLRSADAGIHEVSEEAAPVRKRAEPERAPRSSSADVASEKVVKATSLSVATSGSSVSEAAAEQSQAGGDSAFTASELEAKLWGGFARYAIPELEHLKKNARSALLERWSAAWALTRWFYVEEDYERALENIEFAGSLSGKPKAHFLLAEGQCLVKMGRYEAADVVLERGMRRYERPDFQLLRSTVVRYRERDRGRSDAQADMAQLDMLNGLFVSAGLSPIQKVRKEDALHLSNITSLARPGHQRQDLKVSVVIPAYNAGSTLDWVIASLLQQTWRNLEVIVVDDCSTDDTCEVVERIARRDSRVQLLKLTTNGGAYAARNAGLRHASGNLMTVHDSDDWSHPQRIELQIHALESDQSVIATKSHWVRVSEDLDVIGAWIPKGSLIDLNFSSLLFRRELLDVLGTWDEVLVSGDAEFYSRLKRVYGAAAVVKLPRHQLLAFSLTRESSLTRSKATHLRSLYYGLRGNYRDSYLYWHSQLGGGDTGQLPFDAARTPRSFPIPPRNLPPAKQRDSKYDIIIISDLAMRGGAFVSTLNYIIAACKAGKRTAVFHWRRFDLARDVPLQARLYEACTEFDIDILAPGDTVEADIVLVGYPTILQHIIDPMPDIRAKHVVIVVNQYASRLIDGKDEQYDPLRVREHLRYAFGMEGVWVPISAWVKRLMQQDRRYPAPHSAPWYPMIDVESWCASPVQWRGNVRHTPVIGRHGRDTYTKWPSAADELAQAYGVGQNWEVRFLGGAQHAITMLGGRPANWSVIPFDSMLAEEFLQDLDFYVHYPHEKYIEEFGRGVMEAMAFGIPVILPSQFKETFGSAAIYARPDEVSKVISELWLSRERYLERAQAGRTFVLENCSLSSFPDRLGTLLGAGTDSEQQAEPAIDTSTAAGL